MKTTFRLLWAGTFVILSAAQAQNNPRGHWAGVLNVPGQSVAFEFDIDKKGDGWVGSAGIPQMNASGIPVSEIAFADGKLTFHIKAGSGDPNFSGMLSEDGKTITGTFGQNGATFPFTLQRTGEPKVDLTKAIPPVAKEFVGTWAGALDAAGQILRLVVKISNGPEGATAVMTSIDQGGSQFPANMIVQKDSTITVQVSMIGGEFTGDISKNGMELSGNWTQAGGTLPLLLKKTTEQK